MIFEKVLPNRLISHYQCSFLKPNGGLELEIGLRKGVHDFRKIAGLVITSVSVDIHEIAFETL